MDRDEKIVYYEGLTNTLLFSFYTRLTNSFPELPTLFIDLMIFKPRFQYLTIENTWTFFSEFTNYGTHLASKNLPCYRNFSKGGGAPMLHPWWANTWAILLSIMPNPRWLRPLIRFQLIKLNDQSLAYDLFLYFFPKHFVAQILPHISIKHTQRVNCKTARFFHLFSSLFVMKNWLAKL